MVFRLLFLACCFSFANVQAQVVLDTAKIASHIIAAQQHFDRFDYPKAEKESRLAIAAFEAAPDTMIGLRADAYRGLGGSLVSMNQGEAAREALNTAAQIYEGVDPVDYVSIAQINSNIGISYIQSIHRDFKSAIPWFQKAAEAVQLSDAENKNLLTLNYLGNIGLAHFYLNQFVLAEQKYMEALSYLETPKTEDRTIIAMMEFRLGQLYQRKGNVSAGLERFEKALENYLAVTKEHPFVGYIYRSLSSSYLQKGDYEKALIYAEQARVLFQQLIGQKNEEYVSALEAKGNALEALGRWEGVNECDSTTQAILEEIYNEPRPAWSINIATMGLRKAQQLKDPNIAIQTLNTVLAQLEQMSEPVEEEIALYTLELGLAYLDLGQLDKAKLHLLKALALHREIYQPGSGELVKPNASLAHLYALQGQEVLALTHFELAEKSAGLTADLHVNTISYPVYIAENLGKKAALFTGKMLTEGNASAGLKADSLYKKGLELLEAIQQSAQAQNSKIGLQDEMVPLLEGRLDLLWQQYQNNPSEDLTALCFQLIERGKSFILLQAVQQSRPDSYAQIPDSLLRTEQKIKEDMAFYQKELFQLNLQTEAIDQEQEKIWTEILLDLERQLETLTQVVQQDYPAYYQLQNQQDLIRLPDLQKKLASNQTVLEYFLGEQHLYVLKINQNASTIYKLKKDFDLTGWINELRNSLVSKTSDFIEPAHLLYQKLLEPLGELAEQLIIVPDGVLSYLPFEVLLENDTQPSDNYQKLSYLINKHTISYNFSSTLWQEMQAKKYRPKGLLAMAPSFGNKSVQIASRRDELGALIFNQSEVNNISDIFAATAFLDTSATLQNFFKESGKHTMLHLATHAKLDEQFSDYSYLAFYGNKDSTLTEKLYIRDLYNLQLPLEMVTLSACETGIGKLQKGEGVISLARGFTFAGAKSIITSLWTANDLSTAEIMTSFYKNLKAGSSKDQALRTAKLDFLQEHSEVHPYYWATFIAVGDMNALPQKRWPSYTPVLLLAGIAAIGLFLYNKRKHSS